MSDEFARDLAKLTQALRDEADQCELLGINKPAGRLLDGRTHDEFPEAS